jgi:hypothetical protein
MTWDLSLLLALMTWPACCGIVWVSLCRLNTMGLHVQFVIGIEYATYIAIGFAVPLSPLMGEWPGFVTIGIVYGLLLILVCQWRAWAGDKPPPSATTAGDFDDAPHHHH